MSNDGNGAERAKECDASKVKLSEIKAAYESLMLPTDTPDDMLDLLEKLK
jgi:hypothetical protein